MPYTKRTVAIRIASALILILSILVTISFSGCSMISLIPGQLNKPSNGGSANQTSTTTTTTTDAPVYIPEFFNLLTGLGTTEKASVSRPVSVCIGNTPYALPQLGMDKAEILIEVPVEGGITRLMMICSDYEAIEKIGSVRSTREGLAFIADSFDAIQFYAGTSDCGSSVKLTGYDTLDYLMQNLGDVYYRDENRYAPHNLMTSGTLMSEAIKKYEYRDQVDETFALPFVFADYSSVAVYGGSATEITLKYSQNYPVKLIYDASTGNYTRNQFEDRNPASGNPQFTNVFVLSCDTVTYSTAEGKTLDLDICAGKSGTGYLCTAGTVCEVSWSVGADGKMDIFDAQTGEAVTVNRGTTYIGFIQSGSDGMLEIK